MYTKCTGLFRARKIDLDLYHLIVIVRVCHLYSLPHRAGRYVDLLATKQRKSVHFIRVSLNLSLHCVRLRVTLVHPKVDHLLIVHDRVVSLFIGLKDLAISGNDLIVAAGPKPGIRPLQN